MLFLEEELLEEELEHAAFKWCEQQGVIKIFRLIIKILGIVRWAVPIILIVFCVIDVAKIVTNPDHEKDVKKSIANRLIAAVIVFLVPTLVNLVMNLVSIGQGNNNDNGYSVSDCWVKAMSDEGTGSMTHYDTDDDSGDGGAGFGGANRGNNSKANNHDNDDASLYQTSENGEYSYKVVYEYTYDPWIGDTMSFFGIVFKYEGEEYMIGPNAQVCVTYEDEFECEIGSDPKIGHDRTDTYNNDTYNIYSRGKYYRTDFEDLNTYPNEGRYGTASKPDLKKVLKVASWPTQHICFQPMTNTGKYLEKTCIPAPGN